MAQAAHITFRKRLPMLPLELQLMILESLLDDIFESTCDAGLPTSYGHENWSTYRTTALALAKVCHAFLEKTTRVTIKHQLTIIARKQKAAQDSLRGSIQISRERRMYWHWSTTIWTFRRAVLELRMLHYRIMPVEHRHKCTNAFWKCDLNFWHPLELIEVYEDGVNVPSWMEHSLQCAREMEVAEGRRRSERMVQEIQQYNATKQSDVERQARMDPRVREADDQEDDRDEIGAGQEGHDGAAHAQGRDKVTSLSKPRPLLVRLTRHTLRALEELRHRWSCKLKRSTPLYS